MIKKIQQPEVAAQVARRQRQTDPKKIGFRKALAERQDREPASMAPQRTPSRGDGGHGAFAHLSLEHASRLAYFAPAIAHHAAKYGVPAELICGLMIQESGVNPRARSSVGATGLMQLMPATARRMGVQNIHDPVQNIEGGVRYLRYLMDLFHGNIPKVLAGYNAGEGAVQKYGGVPPFAETQNYVPSVLANVRTIGAILHGGQPAMGALVRNTLPRHAIANFMPSSRETPPPLQNAESLARKMAKI